MATRKGREWGERARTSPLAYGVIGGTVGTLVGMAMKKREESQWYDSGNYSGNWGYGRTQARYYGEADELPSYGAGGYGGTYDSSLDEGSGEGISQKASHKMSDLKEGVSEKASHVKERVGHAVDGLREGATHLREQAMDRASHLRERVPSGHEVSYRARSYYQDSVQNQPLLLVAGALALGAVASMLIPVTDKERRAIGPVRERAKEQLASVTSDVKQRIQDVGERVTSEVKKEVQSDTGVQDEQKQSAQAGTSYGPGSTIPELPPLH